MRLYLWMILIFVVSGALMADDASVTAADSPAGDDFVAEFRNPPPSARPRVFWWWHDGQVTRDGIRRDLEAMRDKGIGGAIITDAYAGARMVAELERTGPVFASPAWRELYRHALNEADRLGIELSLHIQSGWNLGGPLITPEHAMKKIVWSQHTVRGPARVERVLPLPEGTHDYYRDIAVQAFRVRPDRPSETPPIKWFDLKAVHEIFRGGGDYPLHRLREQYPSRPGEADVHPDEILDLTSYLDAQGRLRWTVPEGEWVILRFGYTLTGAHTQAQNTGWDGLSLDHLSSEALEFYVHTIVDTLLADAEGHIGTPLKYLHTDSWEMGAVNWTADFPQEFRHRRGYDLMPYLPVLAGRIVGSRDVSNRFLTDFRRTIADCIADNHYRHFAGLAHERGLLIHPESGGPHAAPIDALKNLGCNDVPMGEFWARSETHRVLDEHRLFGKQAACAAHIYGKPYVNAEAFTTIGPQWQKDPWDLKPVADRSFCEGVNRFVFHQFSQSPPDYGRPGYESFAGTHINPNITWWPYVQAWTGYVSRCQYLLQQGQFVADVCIYYGDDVPNFVPLKRIDPSLGFGYDYDMIDTGALLSRLSVDGGELVLPDGMRYRVLVLPERKRMRLEVVQKCADLVAAGATLVGPPPQQAAGLCHYPQSDSLLQLLVAELWGPCDGLTVREHRYGNGKVVWGRPVREVLRSDGVGPDFSFSSHQEGTMLDFIHRRGDDHETYFVINRNSDWREVTCRFRVADRVPEIWDPSDGTVKQCVQFRKGEDRTQLPLRLPPYGSLFVVFRRHDAEPVHVIDVLIDGREVFAPMGEAVDPVPVAEILPDTGRQIQLQAWTAGRYELTLASGRQQTVDIADVPEPRLIQGPWDLFFPAGWGAPEHVVFHRLKSWTEAEEEGIRYFSGTATYSNTIQLPPDRFETHRSFVLDLGTVRNIAHVRVNDRDIKILWKKPFRVDISDALRPGENHLEIEVTNLWPNRLIGDQLLPPDRRYTRTNVRAYTKASPVLPSGLLGPVVLYVTENRTLTVRDRD